MVIKKYILLLDIVNYMQNNQSNSRKSYIKSSIITVTFWIQVKKADSKKWLFSLDRGEVLIHPTSLSNLQQGGHDDFQLMSKPPDSSPFSIKDYLDTRKIGSNIVFRIADSNLSINWVLCEEIFESLLRNTFLPYPINLKTSFIKVMLPGISLTGQDPKEMEQLSIIPFITRRGGNDTDPILPFKRGPKTKYREYSISIEIIVVSRSGYLENFIKSFIDHNKISNKYCIKESVSFYPFLKQGQSENALFLVEKIIESIISRMTKDGIVGAYEINEKDISEELKKERLENLIKEKIAHERIITHVKTVEDNEYSQLPTQMKNSLSGNQEEVIALTDSSWLEIKKYNREFSLYISGNTNQYFRVIENETVRNSTIAGTLSNRLAVSIRYLDIIAESNIVKASWKDIIKFRNELDNYEQIFNMSLSNPGGFHLRSKIKQEFGIDDMEKDVMIKIQDIDRHLASKGQISTNRLLLWLTGILISLGILNIVMLLIVQGKL